MRTSTPPQVKVCGIGRIEDALLAVELGAVAVGLIFWPGSARYVDTGTAIAIAAALPADVMRVGVFVDQAPEYVNDVARRVGLTAVQLHGSESLSAYAPFRLKIIKAFGVSGTFDPSAIDMVPDDVTVLLDAHDPVRHGGTGRTIDWDVAASIAARRHVILSGGLNPQNVRAAVERVRPAMIDVSSGVEAAPGVKDAAKLRAFFEALAYSNSSVTLQDGD